MHTMVTLKEYHKELLEWASLENVSKRDVLNHIKAYMDKIDCEIALIHCEDIIDRNQ
jgi:hypothetical protein